MNKLFGLAIVLLFASCTTAEQGKEKEKDVDHSALLHAWELVELQGSGVNTEDAIYIVFTEDKKVTGFAGCNRLNGSFKTKADNKISFGQLGVTRMTCPSIDVETKFIKTLNAGGHFKVEGNRLSIRTDDDKIVAVFAMKEGHDIVNRKWKLKTLEGQPVSKVKNQEEAQYFILNEDKSVAGFAGCNAFNGQYKMEGGKRIRFNQNMAVTLKACPDVDVDESAFLSVFELADNYTLSGDSLMLNVGRRAPLAVFVPEPALKK